MIIFQKNAINVDIKLTVKDSTTLLPINISTSLVHDFIFERPDGTWFSRTASFATNGIDGKLIYTTAADDLDQTGHWGLQVELDFIGAYQGRTQFAEFNVLRNIGHQN